MDERLPASVSIYRAASTNVVALFPALYSSPVSRSTATFHPLLTPDCVSKGCSIRGDLLTPEHI